MKTIIRKYVAAIVCLLVASTAVYASNDKPVTVSQLPKVAQKVLRVNFGTSKVALAKMESEVFDKSYDIIFTNGDKIEFDRKGQWTEVSCKRSAVPSALVPAAIRNYIRQTYAGQKIVEISRDSKEYEVKLSNGFEVKFDKNFRVLDIDD